VSALATADGLIELKLRRGLALIRQNALYRFPFAYANAIIEIFDDSFAFVDISKSISASLASGVLSDFIDQPGTFSVTLQSSQSSYINVLVDTSGGATFVVPEPGTLALLVAGLIGFTVRRASTAA